MTTHTLLFEIGIEECPARFMGQALKDIKDHTAKQLAEERIDYTHIRALGTPRRLAVLVSGVSDMQSDHEEEVKGPPAKAAFDAEGRPTRAAEGFAKGQGVATEDLFIKETDAGSYVYAIKKQTGQPSKEVLPRILHTVLTSMRFPKSMRWGDGDMRFVRPVRWIVALFGSDVLPIQVERITSGRHTEGHRTLAPGSFSLAEADDYEAALEAQGKVIVDPEKRRAMIASQVEAAAAEAGGEIHLSPDGSQQAAGGVSDESLIRLLDEVTHLVEWPTALTGGFSSDYLQLPRDILVTSMREHQKYFPVTDPSGQLMPLFVTVRNGDGHALDVVRSGNEKVLAARLADARFFYDEDRKVPLADRVDDLEAVLFQEKLGSVRDKVERVRRIAADAAIGLTDEEMGHLDRAALLAKADLVTLAVGEFPELQGVMGRIYAEQSGESPVVAKAIWEQYLPRHAQDALPESKVGTMLSIAEKIDTIVGCFGVGLAPTGSADPYALRRQALGIVKMTLETEGVPKLQALVRAAVSSLENVLDEPDQTTADVFRFFAGRLKNLLVEWGWRVDLIDASLAVGIEDIKAAKDRTEALVQAADKGSLEDVLAVYERAANLAEKSGDGPVQAGLFQTDEERSLWETLEKVKVAVKEDVGAGRFSEALEVLRTLKDPVNRFFDAVMVMVDDKAVRENRLALLREVANTFSVLARFDLVQA